MTWQNLKESLGTRVFKFLGTQDFKFFGFHVIYDAPFWEYDYTRNISGGEVAYRYSKCSGNPSGYTITDKRTAKRHIQNDEDKIIDQIVNSRDLHAFWKTQTNTVHTAIEVDQTEDYDKYDNLSTGISESIWNVETFLHLLEEESIFELEENYQCSSDIEVSDESDNDKEQEEQEEQKQEQEQKQYKENLPKYPWHRLIAVFHVMFISRFVVDEGAVILISFFNNVFEHYGEEFRLPTSLPTLKNLTGFSDLTSGMS
ncbi:hypothetical protein PHYBLDRAFT_152453 [Phycomyces blakesleeanus NRRL 1555(-)]|uniref:Uncharacterized protein n=1 Tax=Phycomyces blakesleeanus (strain ATCC 8743b / DSM 1359 / FGSC 10004 / NBRC 33097 / NRRL 1555) TaxID=763407 RepID=A0A163CXT2_PHYB8|nr:hypothetical protein PHYBLDRAFT_152453 [Phycomyces blakesleeanus NRRL 1555(-)]OAD66380.1 hypothetical protein PHYBLDRAFT_152453 [Phycomyces blakesleeanus NRRL 1555(-)]|eukprot:XP_018284420.1 hypothetical protein PHYBLDRAFT_152453 [Phycomyces blakesleeanus NRRL 1555(-)]